MRRRIEIIAFERERIVRRAGSMNCPLCLSGSELLTMAQAAALAQVNTASVYRWLAEGKMHGVKTAGGQYRICRKSLLRE